MCIGRWTRGLAVLGIGAVSLLLGGDAAAQSRAGERTARGDRIYGDLCASCHGRYGRGDGPLAANLGVPLPDFSNSAVLAGRTDDEVVEGLVGRSRHASMAIAAVLDPDALRDAVASMRALSVPGRRVSVPAGRDIYTASCWVCHGRDGDGKGPAAENLQGAKPRDFTSPEFVVDGREAELRRSISQGAEAAIHGSRYMPEWSSRLSEQQIDDVIAYLRTFRQAD